MRTRHREATAAKILFLDLGIPSIAIIAAVNTGKSMVERLDTCSPGWNAPQPMSFVQGSFNIETGETIEPLHRRVGKIDRVTLRMTSERDSSEADKAQVIAHSLRAVSALYNVPVSRLLGRPSTAEAENDSRGYYVELAMDASQRNEKLKQELIRQYTNAAAFKLGASATLGVDSDRQKLKQKEIKGYLATCLKLIGCSYSEIETIISELVEGLKNV